ncbi:MAG: signal peptidase II [Deltaproteobacteria bacterium]|nr:signal peptidase II [Deltaproteobacteria bacterium]
MKHMQAAAFSWWGYWKKFIVIVASVVFCDQVTKYWAIAKLTNSFGTNSDNLAFTNKLSLFLFNKHPIGDNTVVWLDNFWRFNYVENTGAAFSFLANASIAGFRTHLLLLIALVAMVFIIVYYRRVGKNSTLLSFALMLVFSGALGNFLDRVRLGYVIDFIVWHWYNKAQWPTFNIADAAITIGVGLMLLDTVLAPKRNKAVRLEHVK